MIILRKILVFFLIFMGMTVTAAADDLTITPGPLIRAGVAVNQVNVLISCDNDFMLADNATRQVVATIKANDKAATSSKKGLITINGLVSKAQELCVVSAVGGPQIACVNNHHYRGAITIHRTKGKNGLTVVETLPLEEYLYGVLPREISPEWPVESLKAQAVAARTYALFSENKYAADGYDVATTTDCQVYGGKDCENAKTKSAVDGTFGQVMMYQGRLIAAYFHSDGGGYTENSENVWGNYLPYLRGVEDYDQDSPHYRWRKEFKPQDIEDMLRAAGYDVGKLEAFELSPLASATVSWPVTAADRGISGRLKTIRIIGSTGNLEISGVKFRSILGLDSALFDIRIVFETEKSFDVDIVDTYGQMDTKTVDVNLPPMTENNLSTDKPATRRLGDRPDETVVIFGYGWGHGLGLSQWGAKAMAERAPAGVTEYFRDILKHYYTGVDIVKIY